MLQESKNILVFHAVVHLNHHGIGGRAIRIAGNAAFDHLRVPDIELFAQSITEACIVNDRDFDTIVLVMIIENGEKVHDNLKQEHQDGGEAAQQIHTGTQSQADARGSPKSGGGGQAFDDRSLLKDDAGTQEADTADHLGSDTGGISASRTEVKFPIRSANIGKAVFGYDDH